MILMKPLIEAQNNNIIVRTPKTESEWATYKEYVLSHYLKKDSVTTRCRFGIFLKDDITMVGIIAYGTPTDMEIYNRLIDKEGNKLFKTENFIELSRLWAKDVTTVHNIETQAISLGNVEVVSEKPDVQIVVTYTDTSQGHTGLIYRASNAIQIGGTGNKIRFFYPVGNPTTKRIATKKLMYFKDNYEELRALYNARGIHKGK